MPASDTAWCVILGAGHGVRAGTATPKQYRFLGGEAILWRAIRAFLDHPQIAGVVAVIGQEEQARYQAALPPRPPARLLPPVTGGATRQDSARAGLEALAGQQPGRVLIHDAARPLVSAALISRVLDGLSRGPCAIPVLPVTDTLRRGPAGGGLGETLDRDGLLRMQTPQGFDYAAILDAHRRHRGMAMTDDAALAIASGMAIHQVAGEEGNIKITMPDDFLLAERLAGTGPHSRTGSGFDVHRFGPGDHVTLCGVRIPHDRGLIGHSDADAGLHALTDALLGTIGGGDIGQHFPPSDPRWRQADSTRFLAHARDMVHAAGGSILNVDVTLICEEPRIGPYRQQMAETLGSLLDLGADQVNIKATTTEGLGFTGRREGIAAQALATVLL